MPAGAVSCGLSVSILNFVAEEATMSRTWRWACLPVVLGLAAVANAQTGLDQSGKPDVKSAGPLAFGPKSVLFVGDTQGAQIFAIGVGTPSGAPITDGLQVDDIKGKVAALLGTMADDVAINRWLLRRHCRTARGGRRRLLRECRRGHPGHECCDRPHLHVLNLPVHAVS